MPSDPHLRRLLVFCGSRAGAREVYGDVAYAFGRRLAERGIGLVFGAGEIGMMGRVADGVLDGGGEAIGVIPDHLSERERPHPGATEIRVVDTMADRKALMFELSDATVALPGALGTLDELFEALTFAQLGLSTSPTGLLEVEGFWEPLIAVLDHLVEEGFLTAANRDLLLVDEDADGLLDRLIERCSAR